MRAHSRSHYAPEWNPHVLNTRAQGDLYVLPVIFDVAWIRLAAAEITLSPDLRESDAAGIWGWSLKGKKKMKMRTRVDLKHLISLFFSVCGRHPAGRLWIHRELRFYHWEGLTGKTDRSGCLFFHSLGHKSQEGKESTEDKAVVKGTALYQALNQGTVQILPRHSNHTSSLPTLSCSAKALSTSPYWKPGRCVPLRQETGVLLWLEEEQQRPVWGWEEHLHPSMAQSSNCKYEIR